MDSDIKKSLISFIVTCKGRLDHLKQSLPALVNQKVSEVILVDYSCEDFCGDWANKNYPSVVVVRVPGESYFSLSRARNIGAARASGNILAFVDADHLVDIKLSSHIHEVMKNSDWSSSGFAHREADICGFFCIKKTIFDRIEGYDEAFKGWGSEDIDIMVRAKLFGATFSQINTNFLKSIPHGDEIRQLNHRHPVFNMDRMTSLRASQLYMHVKIDLMQISGGIDIKTRERLFNLCIKKVAEKNNDTKIKFSISVPQITMSKFSKRIRKSIIYEVDL